MSELITFSTAYYDIGRTNWQYYGRSTEHYLKCFSKVSQVRGNMVIYCDEIDREKIHEVVKDRPNTKIISCPFNELEFYHKFYDRTKQVMESENYKRSIIFHDIPEHKYPEYNIINFNKVSFVERSTQEFDTPYYGWIDFGYGHGRPHVSYSYSDEHLVNAASGNRVFVVGLKVPYPSMLFDRSAYFRNDVCIQGSCFWGNKDAILHFKNLVEQVVDRSLRQECIDDDQTIYGMSYLMDPSLFNVRVGDWFTHFKENSYVDR